MASSGAKRINMSRPTSPPSISGSHAACRKSGARAWATRRRRTGSTPCSRRSTRRRARRKPPERQKGGGHAAQPQTEALLERGELPLECQVRSHALGQGRIWTTSSSPAACLRGRAGRGWPVLLGNHARHLGAQRAYAHCANSTARRWFRPCAPTARPRSLASAYTVWAADNKRHVDRLRGASIKYCYGRRGGLMGARGVRDAQKPPGQGVFLFRRHLQPRRAGALVQEVPRFGRGRLFPAVRHRRQPLSARKRARGAEARVHGRVLPALHPRPVGGGRGRGLPDVRARTACFRKRAADALYWVGVDYGHTNPTAFVRLGLGEGRARVGAGGILPRRRRDGGQVAAPVRRRPHQLRARQHMRGHRSLGGGFHPAAARGQPRPAAEKGRQTPCWRACS